MQLKQLFEDEDAVSPVIGVILMVAITVILAAVIGTFVLGLGDSVNDNGPTANFQFEYSGVWADGAADATVEITHNGGDDVKKSNVKVIIGSATVQSSGLDEWSTTISTGQTQTIDEGDEITDGDASSGDDVRIVWESPSGGSSSTIGQSQIP